MGRSGNEMDRGGHRCSGSPALSSPSLRWVTPCPSFSLGLPSFAPGGPQRPHPNRISHASGIFGHPLSRAAFLLIPSICAAAHLTNVTLAGMPPKQTINHLKNHVLIKTDHLEGPGERLWRDIRCSRLTSSPIPEIPSRPTGPPFKGLLEDSLAPNLGGCLFYFPARNRRNSL